MYIGIDVGGSHIGFAVLDSDFNILDERYVPISKENSIDEIIEEIKIGIKQYLKYNIKSIGIGFPGICNLETKIVTRASNVHFTEKCIPEILEQEFNIPVLIDNDIKCAAIAEYFKGNLKGYKNAVFLGIGTGIGGAIIIDGNMYRGNSYTAGEIGHMTLVKDGIDCGCGKKGCFEKYASLSALRKMYKEIEPDITDLSFFKSHNPELKKIYNLWVESLADGIASIYNILDIEKVVIGGGLSETFGYVKNDVLKSIKLKIYNKEKEVIIQEASFQNKAGVIGAGMLGEIVF